MVIPCKTTQLFWRKRHCTVAEVRENRRTHSMDRTMLWNGNSIGCKAGKLRLWMARRLRFTSCFEVHLLHQLPAPQHTKFGWQELGHPKTSTCPAGQLFYYSSDAQNKLSWHHWGYANTSLPNSCHGETSSNTETIYYDHVNDHSSLVCRKRSIPGVPWSSQEEEAIRGSEEFKQHWFKSWIFILISPFKGGGYANWVPGCNFWWATQNQHKPGGTTMHISIPRPLSGFCS